MKQVPVNISSVSTPNGVLWIPAKVNADSEGNANGTRGVNRENPARDEVVEEHPDRGRDSSSG